MGARGRKAWWLALAGALWALAPGCSDGESNCPAGSTVPCVGAEGCAGTYVCGNPDRGCVCGVPDDGGPVPDAGPIDGWMPPDPDGGSTVLDAAVQQDLFAVRAQRTQLFCDCFYEDFGFLSAGGCESTLAPSVGYQQCVTEAFEGSSAADATAAGCRLQAQQEAIACETAAGCGRGDLQDCRLELTNALLNTNDCAWSSGYFDDLVACAESHRVGSPENDCPGPAVVGSTFANETVGAGDDFNLQQSTCFTNDGAADRVLQWTPQTSGDAVVDTIGSTFDTVLYQLGGCTERDVLACNDDYDFEWGGLQSRLELTVTAGVPLTFVIDGYSPVDMGAMQVSFTTLGCADATALSSLGTAARLGTLDSGDDDDFAPTTCASGATDGPDVVIPWQAPRADTFQISTGGSDFDTVLYVRRSCDPDTQDGSVLFEDACNDDEALSGPHSLVQVSLMRGETVLIVVESKGGGGQYQININ